MQKYGLPYKGSKNKLVDKFMSIFPERENFYDLFCGGCAVSHGALLSKKYKNIFINDIQSDIPKLFLDAMCGKYKYEKRWISREDFFLLKDSDPFVKVCWSFGNDLRTYLYGKDIEEYKKFLHYAVVFRDYEPLKEKYNIDLSEIDSLPDKYARKRKAREILKSGPVLANLESLERLQSLERLAGDIESYAMNYDEVPIKKDSLLYCDIPYRSTNGYDKKGRTIETLDYEKFYQWCRNQQELVIISEYQMPLDFICIAEFEKRVTLGDNNAKIQVEKLFIPEHQKDMFGAINQQGELFL